MATDEAERADDELDRMSLTEGAIIAFVGEMPGVAVVTADEANGAPEISWGDTFFSYDPYGDVPDDRWSPFATIVTKDYRGFDTASKLDRPGVFRLNIAVGRDSFRDLLGYSPAAHAEHHAAVDYSALDQLLPHPVYATQSWVSILNPGERTTAQARALLSHAYGRAKARHRKR